MDSHDTSPSTIAAFLSGRNGSHEHVEYKGTNKHQHVPPGPSLPSLRLRFRFLGFFALRCCDTSLDPFKYLVLMMDEHLAQPSFRGLYEPTVAFGWPPTAFDIVPYTVRVGDIDERVLFIKRADVKTRGRKAKMRLSRETYLFVPSRKPDLGMRCDSTDGVFGHKGNNAVYALVDAICPNLSPPKSNIGALQVPTPVDQEVGNPEKCITNADEEDMCRIVGSDWKWLADS